MICPNCLKEVTTEGPNCPFCAANLNSYGGPEYNQTYGNPQPNGNPYTRANYPNGQNNASLDTPTAAVVAYLTVIGFIVAAIMGDRNDPFLKTHLNNALLLTIAGLICAGICAIPILGWIVGGLIGVVIFIYWLIGITSAAIGVNRSLPFLEFLKLIN